MFIVNVNYKMISIDSKGTVWKNIDVENCFSEKYFKHIFIPCVHYFNVLVQLQGAIDFEFLNMWQQIATEKNTVLFIKSISIDGIKYKNDVFQPFTNMNMCFISCRLFLITNDVAVTSAISGGNEQLVYF